MQISEKLTAAVKKDGRLKKEIAAAAGISAVALSKYLSGTVQPKVESLTKLANALHLPLSYFYPDGAPTEPHAAPDGESAWKERALRAEAKLAHLQRACNALGQHVSALGMTVDDFSKIISG